MLTQQRLQPQPPVTSYINPIGLSLALCHMVRVDGPSVQETTTKRRSENVRFSWYYCLNLCTEMFVAFTLQTRLANMLLCHVHYLNQA